MKGNRFSFSLQSQYVMGLTLALLSTCPSHAQGRQRIRTRWPCKSPRCPRNSSVRRAN